MLSVAIFVVELLANDDAFSGSVSPLLTVVVEDAVLLPLRLRRDGRDDPPAFFLGTNLHTMLSLATSMSLRDTNQ